MSNVSISHAYVMFMNGIKKIVPIHSIENYRPQTVNDFVRGNKYKTWLNGVKGNGDLLLNAFIVLLGESEEDIETQKLTTRIKFPNLRNVSLSSNKDLHDKKVPQRERTSDKSKPTKSVRRKIDFSTKLAREHENNDILRRHSNFINSRKRIIDNSDSDVQSDNDTTDAVDKVHVTTAHEELQDLQHSDTRPLNNEDESSEQFNVNDETASASIINYQLQKSTNVSEVSKERGSTEAAEGYLRKSPSISELSRERNSTESTTSESRDREVITTADIDNDKVHLGEDIYLHRDKWDSMLRKSDSKFVKELAEVFWGRATLKKRCLSESKANKENVAEDSYRKRLTPKKYDLLKRLLYKKVTDTGVQGAVRAMRVRKVSKYMSDKIYDVINRLK